MSEQTRAIGAAASQVTYRLSVVLRLSQGHVWVAHQIRFGLKGGTGAPLRSSTAFIFRIVMAWAVAIVVVVSTLPLSASLGTANHFCLQPMAAAKRVHRLWSRSGVWFSPSTSSAFFPRR